MPLWRRLFLLIIAVLLSGCVTARTGFDYAAVMQKVGPPAPGQSRIVLLSEKGAAANGGVCDLAINSVATKKVTPGNYVYADQPAGRQQIISTQALFPGEARHEITTAPGRTYFLVARASARIRAFMSTSMVAGLAGTLVATAITAGMENPGPVDLLSLDDAA